MIIGVITQQPNEVLDYTVDFSDFCADGSITDVELFFEDTDVEPPTIVASSVVDELFVKFVLTGGGTGTTHKLTIRVTANELVKEDEIKVRIKEI
jgi:hypothetical protein